MGVALYPEHSRNIDELLEYADAAMYLAKCAGKDNFALYQSDLFEAKKQKITMLSELRNAVAERQLTFFLQPKFNAAEQITGAELLCRWHSVSFGQVSPAVFIPLIEEYGLSETLSLQALEHAALYLEQLLRESQPVLLAVNISADLITKAGFLDRAAAIFDQRGLDKNWIELEVTESVFLQEAKKAEQALQQLRRSGFRVAMDDFGTGYSSLSYISRYQFDTIKIDQSFVHDMLLHDKSRMLVEGIVSICQTLGVNVVAEGVETAAQFEFLKSLGVQRFQGYYLAKPQSFAEMQQRFLQPPPSKQTTGMTD
jgi:EAL domain-containing protein (putative c-di-GMP-specific phosphodiesterase class I)